MRRDAILKQLGYSVTPNALEQVQRVMDNTKDFDYVEKHMIALNDALKPKLSFVAISSSHDYFKIKNEAESEEMVKIVNEMIENWSKKYKIELEKVPNKETYYILGKSA
jgi:c-di-AMP phosphodiesterase-like protein